MKIENPGTAFAGAGVDWACGFRAYMATALPMPFMFIASLILPFLGAWRNFAGYL